MIDPEALTVYLVAHGARLPQAREAASRFCAFEQALQQLENAIERSPEEVEGLKRRLLQLAKEPIDA